MTSGRMAPAATCGLALLAAVIAGPANAQTQVFVNETFDYANQSAFEAAWPARGMVGNEVGAVSGTFIPEGDPSVVAGQTGGAAFGAGGGINEDAGGWDIFDNPTGYQLFASPTQNIVGRGDIYIPPDVGTTIRQTIGLRSDIFSREDGVGVNFIEMGLWNGQTCIPTGPDTSPASETDPPNSCLPPDDEADPPVAGSDNFRAETDLGFRMVILDGSSFGDYLENGVVQGPMATSPNWQYFPIDIALDVAGGGENGDEPDGAITAADFADAWHTYEVTISEDAITMTLDLFRDGLNNATGLAGVDSTVTAEVALRAGIDPAPFDFDPAPINSFRFGSPSAIPSDSGVAAFDNLYLALEEVVALPTDIGDYNGDGVVNAADYTVWRDGGPLQNETETLGSVTQEDYDAWEGAYGADYTAATATPEPTAAFVLAGLIAGFASRRR